MIPRWSEVGSSQLGEVASHQIPEGAATPSHTPHHNNYSSHNGHSGHNGHSHPPSAPGGAASASPRPSLHGQPLPESPAQDPSGPHNGSFPHGSHASFVPGSIGSFTHSRTRAVWAPSFRDVIQDALYYFGPNQGAASGGHPPGAQERDRMLPTMSTCSTW